MEVRYLFNFLKLYKPSGQHAKTTLPELTEARARKYLVPLPPFPEQHDISTKIKEMMREVERARAACERQLEAARALPAAYLREVFESEESKQWERKRLGEVLEVIESGSRPKGGVYEIKEMWRVLRPGGEAWILDPNKECSMEEWDAFLDKIIELSGVGFFGRLWLRYGVRQEIKWSCYTRAQIEDMARASRFSSCDIQTHGVYMTIRLKKE